MIRTRRSTTGKGVAPIIPSDQSEEEEEENYGEENDDSDYETDDGGDDQSEDEKKLNKLKAKQQDLDESEEDLYEESEEEERTSKKNSRSQKKPAIQSQKNLVKDILSGSASIKIGGPRQSFLKELKDIPRFDYDDFMKKRKKANKNYEEEEEEEEEEEQDEELLEQLLASEIKSTISKTTSSTPQVKKPPTFVNKVFKLDGQVKNLVSKGNMEYSNGDFDRALDSFTEVIRLAPHYPFSYIILGSIKEKMGDKLSALNLLTYGAQIKSNDPELWKRVSRLANDLGKSEHAIYSLNKALRLSPDDEGSIWEKARLLKSQGKLNKAVVELNLLKEKRPGDTQVIIELVSILTKQEKIDEAIELLESIMEEELKLSVEEISFDSVNLLLDLYTKAKDYDKSLDLFKKISAKFPDSYSMPIDILLNVCIALFAIGNQLDQAETLYNKIMSISVKEIPDIYSFLAEKLFQFGEIKYAIPLYTELVEKTQEYCTPAILCNLAQSHKILKNFKKAVDYFNKTLELVPGNINIIVALSDSYREMGETKRALEILNQTEGVHSRNLESEKEIYQSVLNDLESKRQAITAEDVRLYVNQADAYFKLNEFNQFLGISLALLHGSILDPHIFYRKHLVSRTSKSYKTDTPESIERRKKRKPSKRVRKTNRPPRVIRRDKLPPFAELLEEQEYFDLVYKTSKLLLHLERYVECTNLLMYISKTIRFENDEYTRQFKYHNVVCAYYSQNLRWAYPSAKYACRVRPYSNLIWNLFSRILNNMRTGSHRASKFIIETLKKFPESVPVNLVYGNVNRISGNSVSALYSYIKALANCKDDDDKPLIHLLIGTAILSSVMNRRIGHRHKMVTSSFAFLYLYRNQRISIEPQEVYYNMARAFHQLGISNMAAKYYKLALESTPTPDEGEDNVSKYDLKSEAAFNLAQIYKSSGNLNEANKLLNEYLVI